MIKRISHISQNVDEVRVISRPSHVVPVI